MTTDSARHGTQEAHGAQKMHGAHDTHGPQGMRVEDIMLTRGLGRFVDDVSYPRQLYAAFVRSQQAHAILTSVDTEAAKAVPGVVRVLTAADVEAAGIKNVTRHPPIAGRNGSTLIIPPRPALAKDRVVHVGQMIAVVIAETHDTAQEGAEQVVVAFEEQPVVISAREALRDGAPQIWPQALGNLALDWPGPIDDDGSNAKAVDAVIAQAPHVARVTVTQQRLCAATIEPRGAIGLYDEATGRYTLRTGTQGVGPVREMLAGIMGIDRSALRVVSEEVGGAFGMKSPAYPEYPVILLAAKLTGRPVRWMADRSEAFLSDHQSRDTVTEGELAMDDKGRVLALRVRHTANLGAFCAPTGAALQTLNFARCFPMMYRIPKIDIAVLCAFSNTIPTTPYRGAGRPEANYFLERLMDEAARVMKMDPIRLRQRNLIPRSAMPYKTAVGQTYDSGEFDAVLKKALALADHDGFKQRRRASAKQGRYRGFGLSCFLEHSGGSPLEGAALTFPGGDSLIVALGVQSTGQGHATMYPRLAAERLGITPEMVHHRHGDSDLDIKGAPSVASRSTMTAGSAVVDAIDAMLEKGRKVAAMVLEASETDIAYHDGHFEVVGTDRRLTLFETAAQAKEMAERGTIPESLDTKLSRETPLTYPNGCHIAEVEVDPETGLTQLLRYSAIDDCGNVRDHVLVQGQVHGGVAQGLGQALMEQAYYDPGNGQLLAASFTDYAVPRADDVGTLVDDVHPVPATTNPLGVKGAGEAGTTAAIAAIMNAIADAIPNHAGVALDMPATSEKVWRACQAARATANSAS
ncbi:MAG TPA: xanthine dehydrogenase family protein molybdopterin-binding subunit [Xanthobacteraceae bacterium]|nr:xanthine dehydrogenase family protein molybdopterin-binding subunit [Xanthobacteraceae bacterium]